MSFKPATRAGTKALIGLYGGSGAGKTNSALLIARGLVGPEGQIFMIDTESRRGEMFAGDPQIGEYHVQQMEAPFSSAKYSAMIADAIQAADGKPACLIIDSMSHEWEGVGGVVSAAETTSENRAKQKGYPWNGTVAFGDWKKPKQDHKHMVLDMLGAPLHIICCLRAQYKSHQIEKKDYAKYGINSNAKTTVLRDEFQTPIQDANFIYEMTVHAEFSNTAPGAPMVRKCPEMILEAFPAGQRANVATGQKIAEWCAGGGVEAKSDVDLIEDAKEAANAGSDSYLKWFNDISRADKVRITTVTIPNPATGQDETAHEVCKLIAKSND